MIIADWIAIGGVLLFGLIGAGVGFGKGLKAFTSGLFGVIISVVVCYCLGGLVLKLQFVQDLLTKLAALWTGKDGFFFDLLTKMRMEVVIYYIVLFIIVQLLRILIVNILKSVVESDVAVMRVINKILGAVLFIAFGLLIALLVFQIIYWVGGTTLDTVRSKFEASALKLDYWFFEGNPLAGVVKYVNSMFVKA